jgi:hypothetical protein
MFLRHFAASSGCCPGAAVTPCRPVDVSTDGEERWVRRSPRPDLAGQAGEAAGTSADLLLSPRIRRSDGLPELED